MNCSVAGRACVGFRHPKRQNASIARLTSLTSEEIFLPESVVSEMAPLRSDGPRERTGRTDWDRARLGVVVPLCVVVSIAIICIVVAASMSAQRPSCIVSSIGSAAKGWESS